MGRRKKADVLEGVQNDNPIIDEANALEPIEVAPETTTPEEDVPAFVKYDAPVKKTTRGTKYQVVLDDPNSFLNVRVGPTVDSPSIDRLLQGDVVISANTPKDGWLEIDSGFVLYSKLNKL